jgi:endoglucanase
VEAESYHVMSGVQTETTTDTGGGLNVGWVDAGDWMAYTVTVPTAGSYTIQYRVASPNSTGQIRLEQNSGSTILGTVTVPNTGGWQNWTTITNTITLAAGQQDIAIGVPVGGYNINWWSFAPASSSRLAAPATAVASEPALYPNPVRQQLHLTLAQPGAAARVLVFNARGKQVLSQELPAGTAAVAVDALEPGIYTLRIMQEGKVTSTRFEKE